MLGGNYDMSRTLNKVMMIGNVGTNPELKFTPSGIPVATFKLATSESWKDKDGVTREHTDWHLIVAWRALAEICHKIVRKGSRIYIEGRVSSRSFQDKSGNRKHVVEILADNMLMLDPKRDRSEDIPVDEDIDKLHIEPNLDLEPPDFGEEGISDNANKPSDDNLFK